MKGNNIFAQPYLKNSKLILLEMQNGLWASPHGTITCCSSQQGYADTIAEAMGLSTANNSPLMTPFQSGLPIDAILHVDMTPVEHAPLISKMQLWMGMIDWLQQ